MKLKSIYLTSFFATALFFTACDKENDENEVNAQDETFISGASKSNRSEIELSTIALQKGTNTGVKAYAQMMITEHTTAHTELQSIVGNLDTDVHLNDSLDADQIAMRNQLQALSGTAFDSAYIAGQVTGHQKTLGIFDAEIAGGENTQVEGYAIKYRPGIENHYNMADSILTADFE